MPVSLLAAFTREESDSDRLALNPNLQLAKPGETPDQAFLHADVGLGQLDGNTVAAMPECKGLTTAEMLAKAYDAAWSCNAMAAIISHNFKNAPSPVVAAEAYNAGLNGAIKTAKANGDLSYGKAVLATQAKYAPLLGESVIS